MRKQEAFAEMEKRAYEAMVASEEKEQKRLEEEERSAKLLQARKRELAKSRRDEYNRMFRPSSNAFDPITPNQYDEMLLEPIPAQLDSLLPITLNSKSEFVRAIKDYRRNRRRLKRIRIDEVEKRKRIAELERKRLIEEELRTKHDRLIRRSLACLRHRHMEGTFCRWKTKVLVKKRLARYLIEQRLRSLRFLFRTWKSFRKDILYKKACSAIMIQATSRQLSAKKHVLK